MLIGLIAGGVVLVLLWWFVLWTPTSKDLEDTQKQTESAERAQDSLRATLARLQSLARNAPQQQATLRRLEAAVPETPDLAAFIIEANRIAAESGIEFLSIAPAPPAADPAGGGTSSINLTISIRGGFFQVLEYLNRLETLERVVVVDTINLGGDSGAAGAAAAAAATPSSATSGAGTLSVSLTGRMFTRAVPAGGATAPAGGGATTPTTPGGSTTTPTVPNTPVTPSTNGTTTSVAPGSGSS
jgi:Tfp pilus assembly protein PilO